MTNREFPDVLQGYTKTSKMECGTVYVTYNFHEGKVVELFTRLGKSGSCAGCLLQGIARTLSIALQGGTDPAKLGRTLIGMKCIGAQMGLIDDPKRLTSCMDAIGRHLIEISEGKYEYKPEM